MWLIIVGLVYLLMFDLSGTASHILSSNVQEPQTKGRELDVRH
jgi:hypothetical protein